MSNEIKAAMKRLWKYFDFSMADDDVCAAWAVVARYVAEREQSPAVDHAAMVAKLRELSLQWRELSEAAHKDGEFDRSDVWEDASRRLEKLLSAEPADPVRP